MLSEKGKYAAATQNRRVVWENIVWPLILELKGSCLFFMDRIFGTYTEKFPKDENGNLIKHPMFVSYMYSTDVNGKTKKVQSS